MTSETYLPRVGGAEIHVANVVKHLVKNGYSITLITNEFSESLDKRQKSFKLLRIPWEIKKFPRLFMTVWKEAKNKNLIHCHYSHRMAAISGFVGLIQRKPVIIVLHGMGILNPANPSFRAKLSHSLYRYVSLLLCTHVISTSQDLADVAYKYVPQKKVSVIMNGYDTNLFKAKKSELNDLNVKHPLILTVRRLVPKNGIQFMVDSMPILLRSFPNAKLAIIGDGPLNTYLQNRVNELKINDSVDFFGFKTPKEVADYLAKADVVVFPSTAESASLACAEAMALGKNIVASKVGGLVELLGENEERGTLVKIVDWEKSNYEAPLNLDSSKLQKLAAGIVASLENEKVTYSRRLNALEYAQENLGWEAIVKKTEEVYRDCL